MTENAKKLDPVPYLFAGTSPAIYLYTEPLYINLHHFREYDGETRVHALT